MKNGKVKVGDKIVENGRVYRIFKIKKRKLNGEAKRFAFFRRYYKKDTDRSVVSSLPVDAVDKANIRKPVNKKDIKRAKKILSKGKSRKKVKLKTLKSKFNENDIVKTAEVAKRLWDEKQDRENLPPTKKKLYKKSIRSLSEEFAFVLDKNLKEGKKLVKKQLSS